MKVDLGSVTNGHQLRWESAKCIGQKWGRGTVKSVLSLLCGGAARSGVVRISVKWVKS